MAEIRQDYLTGQWVAIAEGRALRPMMYESGGGRSRGSKNGESMTGESMADESKKLCPFCPENKHMTVEDTYTNGVIRVIPNLYPALDKESPEGFGFHEVIVDTPQHCLRLENFSVNDIRSILQTIAYRMEYFYSDRRIKYVQVFKNQGYEAGASIIHSHWQVLAMPVVPSKILTIGENFERFFRDTGKCYLCDLLSKGGELMIMENEVGAAYIPYAAHYPYCINITPKKHYSDICEADDGTLNGLAEILKKSLEAVNAVYRDLSYNICFYGAPADGDKSWHFHIQLVPRRYHFAGFEISTGCFINSVPPEQAALRLRGLTNEHGFEDRI